MKAEILKILAELNFYPKETIGSERKYSSKYRPAFKIRDDMYNSGQIEFIDRNEVLSGDKHIKAYLIFPYKNLLIDYLKEGTNFTFGEGHKVLGEGTVLSIIE